MTEVIVMGARGRMGSTIAKLAKADPKYKLCALIEREDQITELKEDVLVSSDLKVALKQFPQAVVIDFTQVEASLHTIEVCVQTKAKAVIGTTGFNQEELVLIKKAAQKIPLLLAPNMSIGINVLLKVLPQLVNLLGPDYDLELSEIHHRFKKDAPSGTALKLAECLAEAKNTTLDKVGKFCRHGLIGERSSQEIGVQTLRGGDVVGDHTVYFLGQGERIEVTHRAHSRETFARGALRAAQWLKNQHPGKLYTMAEVLT